MQTCNYDVKLPSCLQAGELGGMVDDGRDDEEGEEPGPAGGAALPAVQAARPPAASRPAGRRGATPAEPQPNSYLVCIVEEPVGGSGGSVRGGTPGGAAFSPGSGGAGLGTPGTQPASQGASQASQAVETGLVAVEPSTGAVLYAQFRWERLLGVAGGEGPAQLAPSDLQAPQHSCCDTCLTLGKHLVVPHPAQPLTLLCHAGTVC